MESPKPPQRGRNKKKEKQRPWLRPGGEEIPTSELREISKNWDHATWEEYLNWYESPIREKHISSHSYDIKVENLSLNPFDRLDQFTKQTKVSLCDRLLSRLTQYHQDILRLYFFAGLSDVQIGPRLNRSRRTISDQRIQALKTLRWGIQGDRPPTCQSMRAKFKSEPRYWDRAFTTPVIDKRSSQPSEQLAAIQSISPEDLKLSFLSLSERQQQALYLRFWCDQSLSQIARELDMGTNTLDALIVSAVARLKQEFMNFQLNYYPGQRSPYAVE